MLDQRIVRILAWNIGILFAGMLLIELWFGGWVRDTGMIRLNMIIDKSLLMDVSKLYVHRGGNTIRYTRDKYGLRGRYGTPDEIGLLTVGGSTTDQRYIADGETWQDNLQRCLAGKNKRIIIANAGIDGQSTYGHIKDFEMWFPSIPGLRPKYILYYVGINDFYTDAGNRYDQLKVGSGLIDTIRTKSAFAYLHRTLRGMYRAHAAHVYHHAVDFEGAVWTKQELLDGGYGKLMKGRLDAYKNRLKVLVNLTRKMGASPIFVTQKTRVHKETNNGRLGTAKVFLYNGVSYNGVDKYFMERELNQTTMAVCKKEGAVCIDLADGLIFEDSDYYDWVHQTPSGAAKIGSYLCGKLQNLW